MKISSMEEDEEEGKHVGGAPVLGQGQPLIRCHHSLQGPD